MLDLAFCLEPFNSSLTEDSFEDNPFSLDFSDVGAIISPPSSEDEGEEDDDEKGVAEEDNLSLLSRQDDEDTDAVMIHPSESKFAVEAAYYSKFETRAAIVPPLGNHPDLVQSIDDDDEPLPLEFFDITSSLSHLIPTTTTSSRLDCSSSVVNEEHVIEPSSLAGAKRKLDECMRRSEHTRRWIKQHVKKTCRIPPLATKETTGTWKRTVTPSAVRPSASFAKHSFRQRGRGAKTCKKKTTPKSAVQLVRDASVFVREKGSHFESSGVLHRSANLISSNGSSSNQTGRIVTKGGCSISDFLRQNKKSISASTMMVY